MPKSVSPRIKRCKRAKKTGMDSLMKTVMKEQQQLIQKTRDESIKWQIKDMQETRLREGSIGFALKKELIKELTKLNKFGLSPHWKDLDNPHFIKIKQQGSASSLIKNKDKYFTPSEIGDAGDTQTKVNTQ